MATHIDVHPAVVLLADIGNGIDIIECSQHSCAGRGVDKERNVALGLALQYEALQLGGDHLAVLVGWHHDAVVSAEAADSSARLDRVMALVRCEHDQGAGQANRTVLLVVGEHLVARRQEGIQIGNGAARRQNRVSARPADYLTHFGEHHVLHEYEHRGYLVCEHVRIGSGGQPFASHGDQIQAVRQLIEEVGMACGAEIQVASLM